LVQTFLPFGEVFDGRNAEVCLVELLKGENAETQGERKVLNWLEQLTHTQIVILSAACKYFLLEWFSIV